MLRVDLEDPHPWAPGTELSMWSSVGSTSHTWPSSQEGVPIAALDKTAGT